MHFTASAMALLAAASTVAAGSVTFWTLDDVTRTVYFTPNDGTGSGSIEPVTVSNKEKTKVSIPQGWQGNYRAFTTGSDDDNVAKGGNPPDAMLAEVAWNNWQDHTSFDVSAIVKPDDHNSIKQIYPLGELGPMSGCVTYPCNNAYWSPSDNKESLDTASQDLVTTLGEGSTGLDFETHEHDN